MKKVSLLGLTDPEKLLRTAYRSRPIASSWEQFYQIICNYSSDIASLDRRSFRRFSDLWTSYEWMFLLLKNMDITSASYSILTTSFIMIVFCSLCWVVSYIFIADRLQTKSMILAPSIRFSRPNFSCRSITLSLIWSLFLSARSGSSAKTLYRRSDQT